MQAEKVKDIFAIRGARKYRIPGLYRRHEFGGIIKEGTYDFEFAGRTEKGEDLWAIHKEGVDFELQGEGESN